MNLSINGGQGSCRTLVYLKLLMHFIAFAASVWLNDVFLNTSYGKLVFVAKLLFGPS